MRLKKIKKLTNRVWVFHEVFAIAIVISSIIGVIFYVTTPSDVIYIEKRTTLVPVVVYPAVVPVRMETGGYYIPRNLYYAINVTLSCVLISIFIIWILMALDKVDL